MLRSILALFLVLSTQTIATDIPEVSPIPMEETQQMQENQNSQPYSLWGSLTSYASSAFSSLQEGTKNATKKVLRHVYSNLPFYSTIGGVCLTAASMTAANAFSIEDCPGIHSYTQFFWYCPKIENTCLNDLTPAGTKYWHCPETVHICSNNPTPADKPYAFIGCPDKFQMIHMGATGLFSGLPTPSSQKYSDFLEANYASLEKGIIPVIDPKQTNCVLEFARAFVNPLMCSYGTLFFLKKD